MILNIVSYPRHDSGRSIFYLYLCDISKKIYINSLMYNVPKCGQKHFKNLAANAARFSECV